MLKKAETAFIEAFERLKTDQPIRLSKGSGVSQANVAREAGVVPSALRKGRFPTVVAMIQQWLSSHGDGESPKSGSRILGRQKARGLREQIASLKGQRDHLARLLVEADAQVVELRLECDRLKALLPTSSVTLFPQGRR